MQASLGKLWRGAPYVSPGLRSPWGGVQSQGYGNETEGR